MATVLVTGATGNVGGPIAARLAAEGQTVRALVRSSERAALLPEGVEAAIGDVADPASVEAATSGCAIVYHAAGLPEQWRLDPADFARVNVEGTRNMVEAALRNGVERFVYTSTIDVFAWEPGVPFNESTIDPVPRPTHYERSKQEADRLVAAALERGLPAVFLHPAGVYGPAPALTPGANDLFAELARGKIPMLLPGGLPLVYNEDVTDGHLRAAADAPVGGRYILSESFHSLAELAAAVVRHEPDAKVPRVMPLSIARAVSTVGEAVARVTKKAPLIPRGALHFLESDARPDASRAKEQLGWTPRPFDEGLRRTLEHFHGQAWI